MGRATHRRGRHLGRGRGWSWSFSSRRPLHRRRRNSHETRRRLLHLAGLAMITGTVLITAVVYLTSRPANGELEGPGTAALQPNPTHDPGAPGIVIAESAQLDLPDPFLVSSKAGDFLFLSTAFGDPTRSNIPELTGSPGHWGPVFDAMPVVPSWALPASAGGLVWDPDVERFDGRYVMYFAPDLDPQLSTRVMHCLGVATSTSLRGPFHPVPGPPIVCQTTLGGDIDADVFQDPGGPRGPAHPNYLVWKSDNNNLPGSGPTTIWAAPLSNDGLSLAGRPVKIFTPKRAWEEPVLEAPQMVKSPDGKDWLFFSAGTGFTTSRYAIGAAKCQGPLGPCRDESNTPFISTNRQGSGPGEETVYVAPDHSTWVLYSPWHATIIFALFRPVEATRIGWNSAGPYVAEAGRFPSPSLLEVAAH